VITGAPGVIFMERHLQNKRPIPDDFDWEELDEEIRSILRALAPAYLARTAEVDDVAQTVAWLIVDRMRDPGFARDMEIGEARRAYIRRSVVNKLHEVRRCKRRSPRPLLGDARAPEGTTNDAQRARTLVARLKAACQPGSCEALALDSLERSSAVREYAAEHGVSERTARRRALDGLSELRRLADRLLKESDIEQ